MAGQPDVFYPIVPDIDWLQRIMPLKPRTIQLRMKGVPKGCIRDAIARALILTRSVGCQLIVNDYWREAMLERADYVHLGQEDLASADIAAIKGTGLRFGISTHDEHELHVALAAAPSYIALGPIFETKLKAMKWSPQGLGKLAQWKEIAGSIPLVAIGGITPDTASAVIRAGADSVSVITDFITAKDPLSRFRTWTEWATANRLHS